MPGKQDGPSRIIYGPPRPPRIAQNANFFTLGPIYEKLVIIVSPVRSTYGGYYGLVVVTPRPRRPRPQTLHRSHDNLKNPYRIASIFYL